MITIISAVIIFCLIIFIHEFGHFITAKIFKVTVHEFAIGMGKSLFSFNKNGTKYSICCFPIGGYVKLEGEDSESADINAFGNKNVFIRFIILFAGAFMNFVLGFVLFVILMSSATGYSSNVVNDVLPDHSFYNAGIIAGDEIVRMNGESYSTNINTYSDIMFFNTRNGNEKCDIIIKRNGDTITFNDIKPSFLESENRYIYGFTIKTDPKSFINVIKYAYYQSTFVVKVVFYSFIDLLTGAVSTADISGPVGIVNEIDNAAKNGWMSLLSLTALLTINLGVVNLLPLPALDGGRIFFLLIEFIRRKPIPPEKEGLVHGIGFMLLLAFMIYISFSDIIKIFA